MSLAGTLPIDVLAAMSPWHPAGKPGTLAFSLRPPSIDVLTPSAMAEDISKVCWEKKEARLVLAPSIFLTSPLEPEDPANLESVSQLGLVTSCLRCDADLGSSSLMLGGPCYFCVGMPDLGFGPAELPGRVVLRRLSAGCPETLLGHLVLDRMPALKHR